MNSSELCREAGITYKQLDHWVRVGYITPTIEASGSGSQREWDSSQVKVISLMARLVKAGLRPEAAVRLIRNATYNDITRVARVLETFMSAP